jgi:GlpG protein
LVNYLQVQGIAANYVQAAKPHEHGIRLQDHNQWASAKQISDEFIANPAAQKYQEAAWQSGDHVTLSSTSVFYWPAVLYHLKHSPFVAMILFICLVTYGLALMGISEPYNWLRILPLAQLTENHQWWRLIGPALIHFSTLHIAFNLLWWWMLGKQIENTFGSSYLIMLFLFTAITSNVAQLLLDGPNFGGLSGVVYALVGCVWWLGWLRPSWGIGLPKPIIVFLLIWLAIGYADLLWIKMANTAHTAGLISGCLFAVVLILITPRKPNSDKDIL